MKILVIEDNPIILKNISRYLEIHNIEVDQSQDGNEGFFKASSEYYNVIILDIALPGKDGLTICKDLRDAGIETPIIMLTSSDTKSDIIKGLETGADDYLGKPFDYEVLLARINSLSRRNLNNKGKKIHIREYQIDVSKKEVSKNNTPIKLSTLEFNLFLCLAQNQGTTLSRKELLERVWGEFKDDKMFSRTVDIYVGYLRKKLGDDLIRTKKGFGYIID